MKLRCVNCSKTYPPTIIYSCEKCNGILEVIEQGNENIFIQNDVFQESMWRYQSKLPIEDPSNIISLREGRTPLHKGEKIKNELIGFRGNVLLKDETVNPTGSFKDRLISCAISKAKELGYMRVICSSSGNAGASAAAYAAKAGMEAVILAPKTTPLEKMTQISSFGAKVVLVEGNYSNSYKLAEKLSEDFGYYNLTTTFINPFGTDALKTVAYELDEQLKGIIPDYIFIPVGSGPLLKGLYQGYEDLISASKNSHGKYPKLIAVQANGCSPIVKAFELGNAEVSSWGDPNTIASGISDPLRGYEKDGTYTLKLVRKSKGIAISVTDKEIKHAMKSLAVQEGIFAEPTGASSFAALKKMWDKKLIEPDSNSVCLITGHGLKDPKVYYDMIEYWNHLDNHEDYEKICEILSINENTN
ncbi:threonine synthase [Neobacillus sp. NPDC097160]|uniref:threonine synthase n=1 Tax=Neobacillus sp. NPDC097160 TaxID=3364298 RepID=UPI0038147DBE